MAGHFETVSPSPPERLVRPLRDAIPVVQWLYGETFAQEDVQSQRAISKVGQQPRHLQLW
jgi:hypothetical protein